YTPAGVNPAYTDAVSSRATGTYDGNVLPGTVAGATPGGSGTLADVALYYYMTDLRGGVDRNGKPTGPTTSPNTTPPNGDVATNNLPSKAGNKDFAQHQHMVTFTVGLADGLMRYDPNYETSTGDFANIKNGAANVCFWATGVCNWPAPQQDQQSALDDLWHATVNGRRTYFLALNPRTLTTAFQNALSNIAGRTASAAAAATSSPNITPKDNFAFSTTYQTNTWSGIVKAQRLDAVTGAVLKDAQGKPIVLWEADKQLLTQVSASGDTRNIWMLDTTAPTKLKPFQFVNMTPAEQAFFMNKCPTMTQCALLTPTQRTLFVNPGPALIGFLRGQTGNEGVLFRDRIETDPVTNATQQTVLGDVFDATAGIWKTIVVGGANAGARGFYALDITDPKNPKGLWEFCSDSTLCPAVGTISYSDSDLGFTYGNPVIGKRAFDGKWVVV